MCRDGQCGTGAQERLQRKRHIGAVPHLASSGTKKLGQSLPTLVLWRGDTHPATRPQLLNRLAVTGRNRDRTVVTASGVRITDPSQGRHDIGGEFSGLIEQRSGQFTPQTQLRIVGQ